jgi:hypothetical protein
VSDDPVQSVDQKICERGGFTIQNFHVNFRKFHALFSVGLGCHKFCARWVPKMLTDTHKTQRMAWTLTFLERYHEDGNGFLSQIVRVTDDETWLSFVNVETKEQSKQWVHRHFPNKTKKFEETSTKADGNCFPGQERSADGGIHAARDHNNVRSELRN